MTKDPLEPLSAELSTADLGDARRTRRLGKIADLLQQRPASSFPAAAADASELEAVYRFLSNEHVSPGAILEPHIQATVGRATAEPEVLVLHDTTYFTFSGEREGLGRVHVKDHGFWAHFALAVTPDRRALGVVGCQCGTRQGPSRWKSGRRMRELSETEESEHLRWPRMVDEAALRLGTRGVVHVADREADWFELLVHLAETKQHFVIRLAHDRLVEEGRVSDLWEPTRTVAQREAMLSGRAQGGNARQRKRHPSRAPRLAQLQIQGAMARVRSSSSQQSLELNFVRVLELDPPAGSEPVIWNLVTTESVQTEEDLLRVVDIYRARWVIEEFFKAIKTGCAFEKRQLGSYHALLNALAVLTPLAWSLLRLRDTSRRFPEAPGAPLLTPTLLAILRQLGPRPLPAEPTARDVTYAVAALGGHLKRNGDPGWITLGRGFERLLEAEEVLRRCDQS